MSKMIKMTKVITAITLIVIAILSIPKTEKAIEYTTIGDRNDTWEIRNLGIGSKITFDGLDMFMNNNIFCWELGQEAWGSKTYTLTTSYEFDGIVVKRNDGSTSNDGAVLGFARGLSYILSYECENQNRGTSWGNTGHVSGNDPKQLALWKYLSRVRWKYGY